LWVQGIILAAELSFNYGDLLALTLNLEKSVGSQKSTQPIDVHGSTNAAVAGAKERRRTWRNRKMPYHQQGDYGFFCFTMHTNGLRVFSAPS